MNVLVPKGQVGLVERHTAPVPLQGLEWVRVAFVVRCIRHASILRVRPVHVPECQCVPVSELLVQELEQHLVWRLRRVLRIARRAAMRNGAAETIATKSRRKVQ